MDWLLGYDIFTVEKSQSKPLQSNKHINRHVGLNMTAHQSAFNPIWHMTPLCKKFFMPVAVALLSRFTFVRKYRKSIYVK